MAQPGLTRVVRLEIRGLDRLRAMLDPVGVARAVDEGLTDAALEVEAGAKRRVPTKTARLSRSIHLYGRRVGPTRVIVAGNSRVRYAVPVHEGSGLYGPRGAKYPIRPKRKKILYFPTQAALTARAGPRAILRLRKSGKVSSRTMRRYGNLPYVFARKVMHPGVRPRPFLRDALNAVAANEIIAHRIAAYWRSRR